MSTLHSSEVTGCEVPGTASVEAERSLGPSQLLDAWHMLRDLGNRVASSGGSLAIAMTCDRPSAPTRNPVHNLLPLAFICGDSERGPDMCDVSWSCCRHFGTSFIASVHCLVGVKPSSPAPANRTAAQRAAVRRLLDRTVSFCLFCEANWSLSGKWWCATSCLGA